MRAKHWAVTPLAEHCRALLEEGDRFIQVPKAVIAKAKVAKAHRLPWLVIELLGDRQALPEAGDPLLYQLVSQPEAAVVTIDISEVGGDLLLFLQPLQLPEACQRLLEVPDLFL